MMIIEYSSFIRQIGSFKWFVDIISTVKKWKEEGSKITDIYIKEGISFSFGILKNFFSVPISTVSDKKSISREDIKSLAARLIEVRLAQIGYKVHEKVKIANSMVEENVRSFSLAVKDIGIMRITLSRSAQGVVMTLRLLDTVIPTTTETKLTGQYLQFIMSLLRPINIQLPNNRTVTSKTVNKGGLIIHCGATGSGKTTSIASQIDFLSKNIAGLIITYEDPVEYLYVSVPNVLQYEIGLHIKPEEIYHHFLRSTAQVSLIGEVRTPEQIEKVVDIASRGHLVFTTLHASNVIEALYVLREASKGNLPLLASVLTAITHQRLGIDSQGKIKPYYEHLMFKDSPSINQIRKMIEEGKPYQEIVNFFRNNERSLMNEGVYITVQ